MGAEWLCLFLVVEGNVYRLLLMVDERSAKKQGGSSDQSATHVLQLRVVDAFCINKRRRGIGFFLCPHRPISANTTQCQRMV